MNRNASGHYDTTAAGGETVRAFVPFPLPPDPPLDLSGNRQRLLERATLALGRLDSVSTLPPDPQLSQFYERGWRSRTHCSIR